MRYPVFLLILCSGLLLPSHAWAVLIRVDGSNGGNPPTFSHNASSPVPLLVDVQLQNDAAVAELILLWQLSLEVVGTPQSTGDVQIVGFADPTSPFFPSLLSNIGTPGGPPPNTQVTFQAADVPPDTMTPPGRFVSPGAAHDLLTLELSSSNQAQGTFQLVLAPFNPLNPQNGSNWLGAALGPQAYNNNTTPGGSIVLANIEFIPEPSTLGLGFCSVLVCCAARKHRKRA